MLPQQGLGADSSPLVTCLGSQALCFSTWTHIGNTWELLTALPPGHYLDQFIQILSSNCTVPHEIPMTSQDGKVEESP